MKKPRIAVLGATGVVGRHILGIMKELQVPYESIKLLSSAKSAGTTMNFDGKQYTLEEAKPESFDNIEKISRTLSITYDSEVKSDDDLVITKLDKDYDNTHILQEGELIKEND